MNPTTNNSKMNLYRDKSFLICGLLFALLVGCNRQEPQVASNPTTASLDGRGAIPVKMSQEEEGEEGFEMELIDIGANPELEDSDPLADTPLYLWDKPVLRWTRLGSKSLFLKTILIFMKLSLFW
jgi:hypothetical protein